MRGSGSLAGAQGDTITVGFSQVGSESGWRTANTTSIQGSLTKENGFDLKFSDAQQKQEIQIQALRSYIAQGVDVSLVVLVVMLAIGGTRYENFLTGAVLSNLFINNAYLIVIAVGMTFVILTGGIDLSVGAVAALPGVLAASLFQAGWPAFVVIPTAVLVGSLSGLLVGMMVHYFEIQPFIASLAATFLARGLSYAISLQSIPVGNETIVWLSSSRLRLGNGWSVSPSVVMALAGRTVYAIGGGEASARLMGLSVARTKILAYVISGTCAGLGGFLFTVYTSPVSGWSSTRSPPSSSAGPCSQAGPASSWARCWGCSSWGSSRPSSRSRGR